MTSTGREWLHRAGQPSLAGTRPNGEAAPIPAILVTTIGRRKSTLKRSPGAELRVSTAARRLRGNMNLTDASPIKGPMLGSGSN
jgi:hypothetical protein